MNSASSRKRIFAIAVALAVYPPSKLRANEFNALMMLKECEADSNLCTGYIAGLIHMHEIFRLGKKEQLWCPPGNVNPEQYIRVFTEAGRRAPQLLHTDARVFIVQSFKAAYPCAQR